MSTRSRVEARQRRHRRVRGKVSGTPQRPRLSVFRSLRHIYAQVVDDTRGHTLVAASTLERGLRDRANRANKTEAARLVGMALAQRAQERAISQVVFDRGGYKYHGRVKALAEAARQAGLSF
ncbi:MAG TPA: 50S ribosomal protein L18 [Dehalococcoidia bacterium]|nr:50S ribosomal protein L18 [Dehalococcoidia bacterium]